MGYGFFLHLAGTAALVFAVHRLAKYQNFKSMEYLGGLVIAIGLICLVLTFILETLELDSVMAGLHFLGTVICACMFAGALYLFAAPANRAVRDATHASTALSPALLAVALATMLKTSFGGWNFMLELVSGLPFVAAAFHVLLRRNLLIVSPPKASHKFWLLSDGLFVVTGLLHWGLTMDGGFTTFDNIVGGSALADALMAVLPMMDLEVGISYNFLLHVPVALAWTAMVLEYCQLRKQPEPAVNSPR